jgi:4-hydroxy-tetrahydrodipicolinate synthase
MARNFRGTYTVMVTPFSDDGSVDARALGSTGEFLSLSRDERSEVAETVIRAARGRVPVLIGTGAEDTREVVRASREAESLGADGVMIIPPFYCTPTEDELFHHFKTVAEAISIPIMIYNNPATANVDLKPALIARLAQIDGCRYIKESTLEVTRVRDIIRLCGDRMTVFGGVLGFESFCEGAEGWVAVPSNIAPGPLSRLFSLVADEGELAEARRLYLHWLPIIEAVFGQAYVGGTKALLRHMGLAVGQPRPPRLPIPAQEDERLGRLVADFRLKFPAIA